MLRHSSRRRVFGGPCSRLLSSDQSVPLSVSFRPEQQVEQHLQELHGLLAHRSCLSSAEALLRVVRLHEVGVRLPREFLRAAVDVCAFRGDSSVEVLVALEQKNASSLPPSLAEDSALASLRREKDLLKFALEKTARYGGLDDALMLWRKAEGQGQGRYLDDELLVKALLKRAFNREHQNNSDVVERLRQVVASNCWNESLSYICSEWSNKREFLKGIPGKRERDSEKLLQKEREKIIALGKSQRGLLPIATDHRSSSVQAALKVQCLVAVTRAQRYAGRKDDVSLREAKGAFSDMLQHDLKANNVSSPPGDSGDVVSATQVASSGSNLQRSLVNILRDQRLSHESVLSSRCGEVSSEDKWRSKLPNYLRSSLSKESHDVASDSSELPLKSVKFDGVDVGADYRDNNRMEHNRRAILELLREMAYSEKDSYMSDSLKIVESFLTTYYPHRRGRSTKEGFNRIPIPNYDAAVASPLKDASMRKHASTVHPSFATLSPRAPISRDASIYQATHDTFLSHLFFQAMFNCAHCLPSDVATEEECNAITKKLSTFSKRLHDLCFKYGISLGPHFHARWILSVPNLTQQSKQSLWRHTLRYAMRVRGSYFSSLSASAAVDVSQEAVINHAVLTHLCGYNCLEAFNYATHLLKQYQKTGSALPLSWNTVLTTAVNRKDRESVIFILRNLQLECSQHVEIPESSAEQRLKMTIAKKEVADASAFVESIYGHDLNHEAMCKLDLDLLSAMLHANLLLNNGLESLRLVQCLRLNGVRTPRFRYRTLLRALARYRGSQVEREKPPSSVFVSLRADLTSQYLLQEMRNDRIQLVSADVCALIGLFAYPAQWHCSQLKVPHHLSCVEAKGLEASRGAVEDAFQLLQELCSSCGLEVDEAMVVELIRICCSANHGDLAIGFVDLALRDSSASLDDKDSDGDDRLVLNVSPTVAMVTPIVSMYCQQSSAGMAKAKDLILSMSSRYDLLPTQDVMKVFVAASMKSSSAVEIISKLEELQELAGIIPHRSTMLQLLTNVLNVGDKDDGDGDGEKRDVTTVLHFILKNYCGEDVDGALGGGITAEDIEDVFHETNRDIGEFEATLYLQSSVPMI